MHKSEVLAATQRMLVRIQHHGYPVPRIHSDRGGEFVNKSFRTFCELRQIHRTTGDPDHHRVTVAESDKKSSEPVAWALDARSEATVSAQNRGPHAVKAGQFGFIVPPIGPKVVPFWDYLIEF